ncbi:MAG TPA: hypothetical protein PK339_15105 [Flavitalea sp.]|nr:hypothetical protein [Flavitalea sp.]
MKLSSLFAKYLYQHKQLKLPGIGIFSIDPAVAIPEFSDKNIADFIQQIKFDPKPVYQADEEFIAFIQKETGKMKPLAESDLDSFLNDGKTLLNLDKPFQLEGIGYLLKTRSEGYVFTPGEPLLDRVEGYFGDTGKEETPRKGSIYADDAPAEGNSARKWLIAASIVAGIALVIWGGYAVYNHNSADASFPSGGMGSPEQIAPLSAADSTAVAGDSSALDSKAIAAQASAAGQGSYKFIIERTNRLSRATKRYDQLKSYFMDIRMDTKDSLTYDLFFIIPAQPSDTSKIKDSLKVLYGSKQVLVANP